MAIPYRLTDSRPSFGANRMVAIVLGVLCIGWLLAGCGSGAVPAGEADPLISFDGTTCTYDGPEEITQGGLTFTMENSSATETQMTAIRFDTQANFDSALALLPVGADSTENNEFPVGGIAELWATVSAGDQYDELILPPSGLYTVGCLQVPSGATAPDHVWRGGIFEIVP